LVYYGQYYRTGLNLAGEGGTNAVLAQRLLEGQRPIVDTFLGYNLMWFYPIVAIFHFIGPNYLAMRIFFFVICIITALIGYKIIKSCTHNSFLSLTIAVFMILVPGMIFRNYMGFIATLSMLVMLKGYVLKAADSKNQIFWMALCGFALGLCFLIRIEPTLLLCIVWLGLAILYPVAQKGSFSKNVIVSGAGTGMALIAIIVIHIPFLVYSEKSGFGKEFRAQYISFTKLLKNELITEINHIKKTFKNERIHAIKTQESNFNTNNLHANQVLLPSEKNLSQSASAPTKEGKAGRLGRPDLQQFGKIERPRERAYALMVYYPVYLSTIFAITAFILLSGVILKNRESLTKSSLIILTTIGCSLSLFPQYFFFRPDPPHLSEFMVPFMPALAVSSYELWKLSKYNFPKIVRLSFYLIIFSSICAFPLYMKAIMPRESAGTIFKTGELKNFTALNGVNVMVESRDLKQYEELRDCIFENSKESDYVVCYPYSPTINFFTNRRSYEHNLYIDNATAGNLFQEEAIQRIKIHKPPLIVIDNWPINKTEISRFKVWASHLMKYIEDKYTLHKIIEIGSRENFVYVINEKNE
jgi:4-amino-4-deoxy-L-arabinose transferase-like glycosyltransferase